MNEPIKPLYIYSFIGGGGNQTYATTKTEAVAQAKAEFPDLANQIDTKSFKRLVSQKAQNAYYKSLPLMD
jgi:hypothetical protein